MTEQQKYKAEHDNTLILIFAKVNSFTAFTV